MNDNQRVLLMIGVLLVFVAVSLYVGFMLRDFTLDGKDCVRQPFIWGAKEMSEKNNAEVSCSCSLYGETTSTFFFTENGFNKRTNPILKFQDE